MPGTPTTSTWWSSHVVGNQGYIQITGAPGWVGGMNDTWLMTLNGSMTDSKKVEFSNSNIGDGNAGSLLFNGNSPYNEYFTCGAGTMVSSGKGSEAAVLSELESGFVFPYPSGSNQFVSDGDFASFTVTWLGTCLDGGCGGEPHFVGFDGTRFDYQGISGHWYTLMDHPMLRISAEFTELDTDNFTLAGTTWITQLRIRIGDDRSITLKLSDFPDDPTEIPREKTLNLERGLVQSIQTIVGQPTGAWVRKFPGGEMVVTCLAWDKIKFLNLSIRLIDLSPQNLTGILGQTLRPKGRWLENDAFDES